MANRVTMSICGTEYILVAEEDAAYMEKIGNMVDAEQADRFTVFFTLPKEEKKPTAWDDFIWLLSGLFSEPKRSGVS